MQACTRQHWSGSRQWTIRATRPTTHIACIQSCCQTACLPATIFVRGGRVKSVRGDHTEGLPPPHDGAPRQGGCVLGIPHTPSEDPRRRGRVRWHAVRVAQGFRRQHPEHRATLGRTGPSDTGGPEVGFVEIVRVGEHELTRSCTAPTPRRTRRRAQRDPLPAASLHLTISAPVDRQG